MENAPAQQAVKPQKVSQLALMAARLSIDPTQLHEVVKATVMPAKDASGNKMIVSDEMFISFLAVANNYNLDPLKKEIYAFPAKGGGIQPVVSIDGWLTIINSHPQFDGMELVENYDAEGKFESVTCSIYRKDRSRPTTMTECLNECFRNTEPWKKPKRMLRHKAAIQCARYAFGLSGIVEQDEAEAALSGEREVGPGPATSDLAEQIKGNVIEGEFAPAADKPAEEKPPTKRTRKPKEEPAAAPEPAAVEPPQDVQDEILKQLEGEPAEETPPAAEETVLPMTYAMITGQMKAAESLQELDALQPALVTYLAANPEDRPNLSAEWQAKKKMILAQKGA